MSQLLSSNSRIAKNSFMLYVRMFFAMAVGFYTSRIVLFVLGQQDFGIYSLVGGLISLLAFLNNTMSGATSRFLTFELGKGEEGKLKSVFDTVFLLHSAIALVVFVVAEVLGIWFVSTLNIPPDRMCAAQWVFQAVVFSMIVSIIQVPFMASVISHEKMGVYAYFEIIGIGLRLAIVLCLNYITADKLIVYAFLLVAVSVIVFLLYLFYCHRCFPETKGSKSFDKSISKKLLSFFGLNLFGNFGSLFNDQALNVLVNLFFGLVYNAATGVASTVSNYVASFSLNTQMAYRPPIIKAYAIGDFDKMQVLMDQGLKMTVFLFALFAIPVIVETDEIVALWLKEVPPAAGLFCRFMIINLMVTTIRQFFIIGIHATGRVKYVSLSIGVLFTINPFFIWVALRNYKIISIVYSGTIIVNIITLIIVFLLLKRFIKELKLLPIALAVAKMLTVALLVCIAVFFFSKSMHPGLLRLVFSSLLSTSLLSVGVFLFCLSPIQRKSVIIKAKQWLSFKQNRLSDMS